MDNKEFVTKSDLKERGWTDSIIKKMSLIPDEIKENPYYRYGPQMKLYGIERIKDLEQTKRFIELKKRSEKRKQSARKTVETKRKKVMDYINSLKIEVPKIPLDELKKEAVKQYNNFHYFNYFNYKNYDPRDISRENVKNDPEFLERIMVNYIRHQLTDYEDHLIELFGKIGKDEAYIKLKDRILDSIAKQYPSLRDECRRQKGF